MSSAESDPSSAPLREGSVSQPDDSTASMTRGISSLDLDHDGTSPGRTADTPLPLRSRAPLQARPWHLFRRGPLSPGGDTSLPDSVAGGVSLGIECKICAETHHSDKILLARCGDAWCDACLSKQFQIAIKDETRYPASCCGQELEFGDAMELLPTDVIQRYAAVFVEYSYTPDIRVYCASACGTFLAPENVDDKDLLCSLCNTHTCVSCKEVAHEGPCGVPEYVSTAQQLIEEQGFQRCKKCHNLVEKNDGCHHVSCRCGHQFCYNCSEEWKTCKGRCEQDNFDEDDLPPAGLWPPLRRIHDEFLEDQAATLAQEEWFARWIRRFDHIRTNLLEDMQTLGRVPQLARQPAPQSARRSAPVSAPEPAPQPTPGLPPQHAVDLGAQLVPPPILDFTFTPLPRTANEQLRFLWQTAHDARELDYVDTIGADEHTIDPNDELGRRRHAHCRNQRFRLIDTEGFCRDCGTLDEEVHLACVFCGFVVCFSCYSRREGARIVA